MLIGVAGPYASGKSETVRLLQQRGFRAASLSDEIRRVLKARGEQESRTLMIETGNALRRAEGPAALAFRLLARLRPADNYVVDSIRHPAEVAALRALGPRFKLVWVDAKTELRLARLRARARPGDPQSADELRRLEGREGLQGAGADPAAQQLQAVRALADSVLQNEGPLEQLPQRVQQLLQQSLQFKRPGWDAYFMEIARVAALRSNCMKRQVAALITRDRRIISTGYNGTPRGTRNCNEGGCARCNSFGPSGAGLGECLCSHAEENAITQAAYHGVSVRGGVIYTLYSPCLICTKMIINSGIAEVVYADEYPLGEVAMKLLREAGVKLRQTQNAA